MTPEEIKTLYQTKEVWASFLELPIQHPDDINEFRFHIHALQNMIYAREGIRKMKEMEDGIGKGNTIV